MAAAATSAAPLGTRVGELDTPVLLLRRSRAEARVAAMQAFAARAGKALRPHTKTHKSAALAGLQLRAGAVGVCCAKISEVEALERGGLAKEAAASVPPSVLVTGPLATPAKVARALAVAARGAVEVLLTVDSEAGVAALSAAVAAHEGVSEVGVLVDVDGGQRRTGASFETAPAVARAAHEAAGVSLRGVQCYVGHLQHVQALAERREASLAAMQRGAELVRQLRAEGLPCPIYTGTGTGTVAIDVEVPELTDMQPGSYVVGDAEYLDIEWDPAYARVVWGSRSDDNDGAQGAESKEYDAQQVPMTVLATVVHDSHADRVTVDAGLKCLYKDGPGPRVIHPPHLSKSRYEFAGDEHGYLFIDDADVRKMVKVGDKVEILVSHCDPTVNLHSEFIVLDDDDRVARVWPVDARGCMQ